VGAASQTPVVSRAEVMVCLHLVVCRVVSLTVRGFVHLFANFSVVRASLDAVAGASGLVVSQHTVLTHWLRPAFHNLTPYAAPYCWVHALDMLLCCAAAGSWRVWEPQRLCCAAGVYPVPYTCRTGLGILFTKGLVY
jgi:hypothetical protein